MTEYVAFLRGISSGVNPGQRMDRLRKIFEDLGFQQVQTVIASGNVLFETGTGDKNGLERRIEKALKEETHIGTVAIIRTRKEIERLIDRKPFEMVKIGQKTRPYATFLKDPPGEDRKLAAEGKGYTILGIIDDVVLSVVDLSSTKTPQLMSDLEKEFGNNITTRSWFTVLKIAEHFEA